MDTISNVIRLGSLYPTKTNQEHQEYVFRLDGNELKKVPLSETSSIERDQASHGAGPLHLPNIADFIANNFFNFEYVNTLKEQLGIQCIRSFLGEIIRQCEKHNENNVANKVSDTTLEDLRSLGQRNWVLVGWWRQFHDNFLSHTVRNKAEEVLQSGIVKPAEMVLRSGEPVDYEVTCPLFVNHGRGIARLPKLNEEELKSLEKCLFSEKDKARLSELQNAYTLECQQGKNKYKEFSIAKQKIHNQSTKLPVKGPMTLMNICYAAKEKNVRDEKEWDSKKNTLDATRLFELRNQIEQDKDVQLYLELVELKRKQAGLRALFQVNDKLSIEQTEPKMLDYMEEKIKPIIEKLAQQYNCNVREILIAFDQAQPEGKKLDDYLRKKMSKLSKDDMDGFLNRQSLSDLRAKVLKNGKLSAHIRMSRNCILSDYGPVSILIGGDTSKINSLILDERFSFTEAVMRSPIEGENFYAIDLMNTENLLILGPREILKKYKESYGDKIVYNEELSFSRCKPSYIQY